MQLAPKITTFNKNNLPQKSIHLGQHLPMHPKVQNSITIKCQIPYLFQGDFSINVPRKDKDRFQTEEFVFNMHFRWKQLYDCFSIPNHQEEHENSHFQFNCLFSK
jgi:hypothetical protein